MVGRVRVVEPGVGLARAQVAELLSVVRVHYYYNGLACDSDVSVRLSQISMLIK